jgi:hypothetical protein
MLFNEFLSLTKIHYDYYSNTIPLCEFVKFVNEFVFNKNHVNIFNSNSICNLETFFTTQDDLNIFISFLEDIFFKVSCHGWNGNVFINNNSNKSYKRIRYDILRFILQLKTIKSIIFKG